MNWIPIIGALFALAAFAFGVSLFMKELQGAKQRHQEMRARVAARLAATDQALAEAEERIRDVHPARPMLEEACQIFNERLKEKPDIEASRLPLIETARVRVEYLLDKADRILEAPCPQG